MSSLCEMSSLLCHGRNSVFRQTSQNGTFVTKRTAGVLLFSQDEERSKFH